MKSRIVQTKLSIMILVSICICLVLSQIAFGALQYYYEKGANPPKFVAWNPDTGDAYTKQQGGVWVQDSGTYTGGFSRLYNDPNSVVYVKAQTPVQMEAVGISEVPNSVLNPPLTPAPTTTSTLNPAVAPGAPAPSGTAGSPISIEIPKASVPGDSVVTVVNPDGKQETYKVGSDGLWKNPDGSNVADSTKIQQLNTAAPGKAPVFLGNNGEVISSRVSYAGTNYDRQTDGTYKFTDDSGCKAGCTINANTGKMYDSNGGEHDVDPNVLSSIRANNEQVVAVKSGKNDVGKDPNKALGPDGKPLDANTNFEKMSWNDVKKQIAMSGWFDWITGGPITGNLNTIGASWFGENFPGGGQDAYNAIKNSMTINSWAERICEHHLNNAGGTRGILTSPSGMSYAHAEGEYTTVEPCAGASYNASCKKYYAYKISAEVSAGEVPMTFNIYISGPTGSENLYPTDVILTQGQLLSLSGASMFYWESYNLYTTICIQFTGTTNLDMLFGAAFDNPICQPISAGAPREYQGYLTTTGPGAGPMPTPGGVITPGTVPTASGIGLPGAAGAPTTTTPRPGLGG